MIELIIIAVMVGALYLVTRVTKTGKNEGLKIAVIDEEKLVEEINEEVKENEVMKGYRNVALFAVDISNEKKNSEGETVDLLPVSNDRRTSGLLKGFRSDTMMIASINQDTGDIKLVSVLRDTFLNIGDSYTKCNAAYAKGGAEQAIKMLNNNLDLDIKEFVTVSYWALIDVIDALGGVDIDVQKSELHFLNDYVESIAKTMGISYNDKKLATSGYQTLTGIQAAAYCRIRYIGNDYGRTERQRNVLKLIEEKAKKADVNSLLKAFENAQKDIYTNITSDEIVSLISQVMNYRIVDDGMFPRQDMIASKNMGPHGACLVANDLETNVKELHKFLFNEEDYNCSNTVQEYSKYISSYSSKYKSY